jgi:hypothetical protein
MQSTFFMLGNRLGATKDAEQDEFERKEIVRRTTRVPLEQTIAEIGEGRGMSNVSRCLLSQPDLNTPQQVSSPLAMRSADESASRRSTVSKSTPSAPPLRAANKRDFLSFFFQNQQPGSVWDHVHNSSRRRAATLENWSLLVFFTLVGYRRLGHSWLPPPV